MQITVNKNVIKTAISKARNRTREKFFEKFNSAQIKKKCLTLNFESLFINKF